MKQLVEVPIADVLDVVIDHRGLTPKKLGVDWASCGVQVISAMNIKEGKLDTFITQRYVAPKVFERWMPEKLRRGDILMTSEAPLGAVAVFEEEGDFCLGQRLFALRAKPSKLDQQYFFWVLQAPLVQNRFVARSTGTTAKGIRQSELLQVHIPLPPLEEQRRIAAILDKADGVRRKRQEAIRLTEELLRSQFLEMFGDPVTNPKGWEMVTVGDIVSDVRDGPHVSPKYSDEGIPILSTRNIRPAQLIMEDMKYVSKETYLDLVKTFRPQRGDVLLTKGGTTGYAKTVDWDWSFSIWVHIAALRPTEKIRPEFLEAALNSPNCYQQSQRYTHGIANKDLGLTRIRKIKLSLPPLDLQDKYCCLRERLLKQLVPQEKSLNESENLFNSLLQRAFRGEL